MRPIRSLAAGALTLLMVGLAAGCGGGTGGQQGAAPAGGSGGSTSSSSAKQIEIFSWWTAGGEADGLKALIDLFQKQDPGVQVINEAVAGGAGSNAKAVLANRMSAGNPPDTFQVHAGEELMAWVNAGKMQPLDSLYQQQSWNDVFPKQLIDMLSKNGHVYAVPVDIHRGNVLWYNKKIFDQYNLKPPTTFQEFFQVADALKAHGVTPLALADKDQWEATMLWEDVLLGVLGPEKYDALWKGQLPFDDPGVRQATQTFVQMLDYVNPNHAALEWQDGSQMVADGKAAMNVMGDWAKGYFTTSLHLQPGVDFGWTTTPGTAQDFMVVSDAFGLPVGAKHPQEVTDFLKVLGSKAGQDAFNPLKGSIPARTDGDPSKYDTYSQQAMQDFKVDALTPSLAHGSAASPAFLTAANQAVNILVSTKNVDQFLQALKTAAQENGIR
ncbi:MAG: extracellular solute-binding protein [Chloroflexi bacterium]|nr:extracellular solute-binding protein [Chloroflexota bacterium]